MSFKPLFTKSLGAAPGRLHFAAHSHHLWPDASFEGQVECWEDAAARAETFTCPSGSAIRHRSRPVEKSRPRTKRGELVTTVSVPP